MPLLDPTDRARPDAPTLRLVAPLPADEPVLSPCGAVLIDDPACAPACVDAFAASTANIVIVGETGAGKEVLARRIHARSGRPGPLVAINCAALTDTLLESELFGHALGAFTGATRARPGLLEAAGGGTFFLDEIGELPLALQPKLLRAIEAREVLPVGAIRPVPIDVRFVAATHRDLVAEVAAGRFRADLYYRLDGITLRVAALRDDPRRIGSLALQFLAAAGGDAAPSRVTPAFRAQLEAHAWPGNVRELKAVCERAVLLAAGGVIDACHLVLSPTPAPPAPASVPRAGHLTDAQELDRARIVAALAACAGNQRRAAAALGVSRTTLVTRLALYRIPRPRRGPQV